MRSDDGLIVAFAGASGSGKTTLATALAYKLGGATAGFGHYVRYLAASVGDATDRASLQDRGQIAVDDNPRQFAAGFLRWADFDISKPIVIEGMRHVAVDEAIRAWAQDLGTRYFLAYIETPTEERANRRSAGDIDALRQIDAYQVERETMESLPSRADLIIDGATSLTEQLSFIKAELIDRLPELPAWLE